MTIAFDQIPANILVPLFWAEVRPGFQPVNGGIRMLLIGARTKGNANDVSPLILSDNVAAQRFGRNSMVAAMYAHARAINPLGEIWGAANKPGDAPDTATGELSFDDPNGKSGIATLKIGENVIKVKVKATDDDTDLATSFRKAINGNKLVPVTASANTNAARINLTAAWPGESGNEIKISTRWYGKVNDFGDLITVVDDMHGGSGGGGIADVLAALNDDEFDVIVNGFDADASMTQLADFLTDRWAPGKQLYGHGICSAVDTFGDLVTKGDGFNEPHISIFGAPAGLTPPWCWAAETGAHAQFHLSAPPEVSRPLHGLELTGVDPSSNEVQWFDVDERQSLYEHGISSYRVDNTRRVLIDGTYTTYKTNVWGDPDASWRGLNTMFQTMYFVRYLRAALTSAFPRAALTDEPTGIPGFCSPGEAYDVIVHAYNKLASLGLVENPDLFAQALVVERDQVNVNRLNFYARPDMVNQLDVLAGLIQTELQLTDDSFAPAAA